MTRLDQYMSEVRVSRCDDSTNSRVNRCDGCCLKGVILRCDGCCLKGVFTGDRG